MANRSYLYAIDALPGVSRQGSAPRGLSEFNWSIPLAHKLFVGFEAQRVQSVIWPDHRIAIVGDFERGARLVMGLLDAVGQVAPTDPALDDAIAHTREFLTDPAHRGRYALLEAGEIFDLFDRDLEAQARELVELEIPALVVRAQGAIRGENDAWIKDLRRRWDEMLGIGFWSDVLYYSLGKDTD